MAATSQTATTLTPPTSSHGTGYSWANSSSGQADALQDDQRPTDDGPSYPTHRQPLTSHDDNLAASGSSAGVEVLSREASHISGDAAMKVRKFEGSNLSSRVEYQRSKGIADTLSPADSLVDLESAVPSDGSDEVRINGHADPRAESPGEDNSKWIHRDKLAKIESEELQAAGIVLPRVRSTERCKSRPRTRQGSMHQDSRSGEGAGPRSRKNSAVVALDGKATNMSSWDQGDAVDEKGWVSGAPAKGSRIPVPKSIYTPAVADPSGDKSQPRKRGISPVEHGAIKYAKPRTRSASTGNALAKTGPSGGSSPVTQPKRSDTFQRKPTLTSESTKGSSPKSVNGTSGRPKTREGLGKGNSTGRLRSRGERELSPVANSKPMEGDPPWMVSAYQPDPRLPPEQQLLPTVAKRLQQEKWEKEGKFGTVYDKEFRPLTDQGFLKPPKPNENTTSETEPEIEQEVDVQEKEKKESPMPALKLDTSPSAGSGTQGYSPVRVNSYSTMPKIADKPSGSPLASPMMASSQPPFAPAIRIPDSPEDIPKKEGCLCCIVM